MQVAYGELQQVEYGAYYCKFDMLKNHRDSAGGS